MRTRAGLVGMIVALSSARVCAAESGEASAALGAGAVATHEGPFAVGAAHVDVGGSPVGARLHLAAGAGTRERTLIAPEAALLFRRAGRVRPFGEVAAGASFFQLPSRDDATFLHLGVAAGVEIASVAGLLVGVRGGAAMAIVGPGAGPAALGLSPSVRLYAGVAF